MYTVNKIKTFHPACRCRHGPSRTLLIFCLLISGLFYLAAAANTASAAIYYLDAVNGDDGNDGSSVTPWRTLSKAQSVASDGDTVYLRSGNYGEFIDETSVRMDWLTYKADDGHQPVFTHVRVGRWDGPYDLYLHFEGITITPGYPPDGATHGVDVVNAKHVKFVNVTVIGTTTYTVSDGSAAFYLRDSSDIDIDGCTVNASSLEADMGFEYGIFAQASFDINVLNCDIQRGRVGIRAEGTGWLIKSNHIHNTDSDGLWLVNFAYSTIENNHIEDIGPRDIFFSYSGGCHYNDSTKTITANEGNPWEGVHIETAAYKEYVRITPQGESPSDWYYIDSNTTNTITLVEAIGQDYPNISLIELRHSYHADAIQAFNTPAMDPSHPSFRYIEHLTITGNHIHDIVDQGIFFNVDLSSKYITIENNLLYECYGTNAAIGLFGTKHLRLNNNTVAGQQEDSWTIDNAGKVYVHKGRSNTSTIDEFANNIVDMLDIDVDSGGVEDINYANHNIVCKFWVGMDTYNRGPNTLYFNGNLTGFKNLFTNYDNRDFTLGAGSAAIDFANPTYAPATDILGVSRVFPPDAGCYEYVLSDPNNQAPILEEIGDKSVNENSTLTFDVNATDADGDAITYSVQNRPSGATFVGQTFSWTPSYEQSGSYDVTFIASDGKAQDSEPITITVNNVNRAPVFAAISDQSIDENSTLSFSVSATDPDGDTITYSLEPLPTGAVFGSQTFTWTPGYDQAGIYDVNFIAADIEAQDSETITITVNNVNRPPVLSAIGNKSVYADDLLNFTVNATDPDSDTITYSASNLPSGADFDANTQTFNWTPGDSQADSYDVTFTASDGEAQDSEMITITVTADTSAPTVTNLSPQADSIQAPLNTLVILHIVDAGKGVDANSVTINVNNNLVYSGNRAKHSSAYGQCHRIGTKADYKFIYQSEQNFEFGRPVSVTVNATDLKSNEMDEYSYSFRAEMRSFGENKRVDLGNLKKGRPVTVRDDSNDIWAAWHAGPIGGSRDIYIGKLLAEAKYFGDSINLTNDANDQCNPVIAVGSDNKLYVAWQDNRRGNWDIYISTSNDGENWSTERVTDSNDNQINPAIVVDSSLPNNAYIVWEDDRHGNQDIYIATSSDGFSKKTQITSDSNDQVEPAIAADSDNTIYVVWTDTRNHGKNDIYGAASNGSWTNIPVVTEEDGQSSPAIAAEAVGSVLHLVWVDDRIVDANDDIFYDKTSGGLTPLTGSSIIDDNTGADQISPVIITTGSTEGDDLKVFACWRDERNKDADLYFDELSAGDVNNVFVGDEGTNSDQSEPAIGIDGDGQPYLVWTNERTDICYAGSTFIDPDALASKNVSMSLGATVGTEPASISSIDDVSAEFPPGAYLCDVEVTISKIKNPQRFSFARFNGPYEFGPSGMEFIDPVTITIPYEVTGSENVSYTAYWYNPLTSTLSQEGITDVQTIVISSSLHALRFKTTHFSPFIIGGAVLGGLLGGGGGGGCSMSPNSQDSIAELLLPYIGLALAMVILKLRDRRKRKAHNITKSEC